MFSDLRHAFRQLKQSPGFTLVATLALALGIATSTTMFTLFNAVLLRPLPFIADENTFLRLRTYNVRAPEQDFDFSLPDFSDVRTGMQSLSGALTVSERTYIIGDEAHPERVKGSWITVDALQTMGSTPELGRKFNAEEAAPGAPEVVILGHGLWQRNFGGKPDIVGRTITLNSRAVTVVGVMPKGFGFPDTMTLWQPFPNDRLGDESERGSHGWPVWARMKPGATLEQVQAELDALGTRLEHDHPVTNGNIRYRAYLARDAATQHDRRPVILMMGAVLAVLLIACGNVANLLLARAATRAREIAVRAALGASRPRLVAQMLVESLLLGACGGGLGLLLTFWQTDFVLSLVPVDIPYWLKFEIDWRVLTFALLATVGASLFFGLFPAIHATKPDLVDELKDGARGGTSGGRARRVRNLLVVVQLALALVLLVAAGLLSRSFLKLQGADTGLVAEHVLTFRTGIPPTITKNPEETKRFFTAATENLLATPGVVAAGWMSYLPLQSNANDSSFAIEGRPEPKPGAGPFAIVRSATPGAFAALQVPLVRGRLFNEHDEAGLPIVVVVDRRFAEKFFPGEDPVGRRLSFGDPEDGNKRKWCTIVGLVGNIRQRPEARGAEASVWVPLAQHPDNFMSAVVRVQGDPLAFRAAAQKAVLAARAGTPIYYVSPMTKVASDGLWAPRFFGSMFAGFAVLAVFLSALGVYGVMAYNVAQRSREIGVRMALGATSGAVVGMVLRQGLRLVALGLGLGFVGAWMIAKTLAGQLYEVQPHDPPTFFTVPLLLALVALAASWLPSRRATRVDPILALRAE